MWKRTTDSVRNKQTEKRIIESVKIIEIVGKRERVGEKGLILRKRKRGGDWWLENDEKRVRKRDNESESKRNEEIRLWI